MGMGLKPTKPTRSMKAAAKASTTILDSVTKTLRANSMFTRDIKATQMAQWVTSITRNSMVIRVEDTRASIITASVKFRTFDYV